MTTYKVSSKPIHYPGLKAMRRARILSFILSFGASILMCIVMMAFILAWMLDDPVAVLDMGMKPIEQIQAHIATKGKGK